jgi:hypothetical protein
MANILLILCVVFMLTGCSFAVVSKTIVTDTRPTLSFVNAPEGASVAVDGLKVGLAEDFKLPKVLYVEPGTHQITVYSGGSKIYEQSIFVDSEHKTINVH